ncbi:MAG: UbiA prenyltransferase family protein [Bacilli bacterium]|nr:UbiA prenyltransferase family protein [Bacilli bacterium]
MKNYIKLIRVKHWLKNFLIFLPAFFSINIFNKSYIATCSLGFLVFCFASSIIYILNDINDIEKDRLHPVKKYRPLASNAISKKQAYFIIILLIFIISMIIFFLYKNTKNIFVILIPLIYIILNIFYSKGFKNIPIIDVVILVSGFVLRVMYGGEVINVEVSKYLYLMIIFGSFYLGFGKRRNEIIKNGNKGRKVLEYYNKDFLDKNMYVCLALAIVSYTLWCVDKTTITRIGNDYLFWTIPIVMVILQLYSLNIEGNSHGDPIEVVLADKKLIIVIIIYIIVMGGLLYLL